MSLAKLDRRPSRSRQTDRRHGQRARKPSSASSVEPPQMAANGGRKYVYSIISATDKGRFTMPVGRASQAGLHAVDYRDIAAVVSDALPEMHEPTRANMLAHERVNTALISRYTVIPVSFGTVFKTRDDVVELLHCAYEVLREALDDMRDKVEFGLKVLWDRETTMREIEASDEALVRLRNALSSRAGSSYLGRVQYGRLIDAALELRCERYVAEILERMQRVALDARPKKPLGDKMILNAAYLVSRARESEFEAALEELGRAHDELTLKFSGPWPPYNFVDIRLSLNSR